MTQAALICNLLFRLGVTANYTGFFHLVYAVQLCAEQPEHLLLITKRVYPEVAKKYRTSCWAVERNIRTVSSIMWEQKRHALEHIAGRPLTHKPSNAQLLAILSQYSICSTPPP